MATNSDYEINNLSAKYQYQSPNITRTVSQRHQVTHQPMKTK